ncbi:temptin [Biomphalaria glabrata]|nr:temptin [Biomphalaria glabrata]
MNYESMLWSFNLDHQIQMVVTKVLIFMSSAVLAVNCFPSLRARIPNGNHVRNPCPSGGVWEAVGHFDPIGWGELNPFGYDFQSAGFQWTESLCRMDSDSDGMTNGFELGDPTCTWTPNSGIHLILNATGHPGVCEPLQSHLCTEQIDVCSTLD